MESKAENVVQNIGAIAETVSVFYNSIVKQVPRDVALILTQHFMDITIARRSVTPAQLAQAAALAEARRKGLEKKRQTQTSDSRGANPQEMKHREAPAEMPERDVQATEMPQEETDRGAE